MADSRNKHTTSQKRRVNVVTEPQVIELSNSLPVFIDESKNLEIDTLRKNRRGSQDSAMYEFAPLASEPRPISSSPLLKSDGSSHSKPCEEGFKTPKGSLSPRISFSSIYYEQSKNDIAGTQQPKRKSKELQKRNSKELNENLNLSFVTSGMGLKAASKQEENKVAPTDEQIASILDHYKKLGFDQLYLIPINKERVPEGMEPIKGYSNYGDIGLTGRMSVRLFVKDKKFYQIRNRHIYDFCSGKTSLPNLNELNDGPNVFLMLLRKNMITEQYEVELRLLTAVKSGHPALLNKNEHIGAILAAGELTIYKGKIVAINNKSGHFYHMISAGQGELIESCLKDFFALDNAYFNYPANMSSDKADEAVVIEIAKRKNALDEKMRITLIDSYCFMNDQLANSTTTSFSDTTEPVCIVSKFACKEGKLKQTKEKLYTSSSYRVSPDKIDYFDDSSSEDESSCDSNTPIFDEPAATPLISQLSHTSFLSELNLSNLGWSSSESICSANDSQFSDDEISSRSSSLK